MTSTTPSVGAGSAPALIIPEELDDESFKDAFSGEAFVLEHNHLAIDRVSFFTVERIRRSIALFGVELKNGKAVKAFAGRFGVDMEETSIFNLFKKLAIGKEARLYLVGGNAESGDLAKRLRSAIKKYFETEGSIAGQFLNLTQSLKGRISVNMGIDEVIVFCKHGCPAGAGASSTEHKAPSKKAET